MITEQPGRQRGQRRHPRRRCSRRRVGRQGHRPLQEPRQRVRTAALDALPRRPLRVRLRRRVHPRLLDARRERQARRQLSTPIDSTRIQDSAGVWPYHDHSKSMSDSISGGLYGAISILGRDEKPPDREFVVYFGQQLDFRTVNGRAFVGTRLSSVRRSARSCSGTSWRSATTITRSTSTATAGRFRAGLRTPAGSVHAESFAVRWQEDVRRHVALPLPRRGSHDERDDRDLPGDEVRRRAWSSRPSWRPSLPLGRLGARTTAEVSMPAKLLRHATRRPRRHVRHLAERRSDDAHGHRGRRRGSTLARPPRPIVLDGVHEERRSSSTAADPSLHAGDPERVRGRAIGPEPSLCPPGGRARLEGVAPAGVDEVELERVAPGPRTVVGGRAR